MQPKFTIWLTLLCFALAGNAQTSWTGTTSTDWFDNSNWDNNVPTAANQPATIPNPIPGTFSPIINTGSPYVIDFELIVESSLQIMTETDIANNLTISAGGTVAVNGSFIDITTAGVVTNNGGFIFNSIAGESFNSGLISGSGSLVVSAGGALRNRGNGQIANNGVIEIYGFLNNFGAYENNQNTNVYGGGTLFNRATGVWNNNGLGTLQNFGTVVNVGTLTNNQSFVSSGLFRLANNGVFINNNFFNPNGGNFNIEDDGVFRNQGNAIIGSNLLIEPNAFYLNIISTLFVSTSVVNNDGTFQNEGDADIAGLFNNAGLSLNNGSLTNNFGSTFSNLGTLTNNSCDYLYHYTSNPINTGIVNNFGIIYAQGSMVTVTNGNGAYFNMVGVNPTPTANCAAPFTVNLDNTNNASITPAMIDNGSVAPYCGVETLSINQSTFTCDDLGQNTITLTVTDSLGFTAQCQTIVTVADPFNPTITCPANIETDNEPGLCGATINYMPPVGMDNCPNATTSITGGIGTGGFFPVDTTTETYTVTDAYGNTASCSFTVIVLDVENPEIFCPADITVELDPFECVSVVTYSVTATDNCTVLPFIYQTDTTGLSSGSEFPIGTTILSYMAIDGADNSDVCSFSVTVNEYVPLSNGLACNDNAQVSLDATCESEILPEMVLMGEYGCSDDFSVQINGLPNNIVNLTHLGQTLTVRVTNNDTGNSCWGEIIVMDKFPPTFDSCMNDTLLCVENTDPTLYGGDAHSPVVMECSSYDLFYIDDAEVLDCTTNPFNQRIERMWIAQDTFGLRDTCIQIIMVRGIPFGDISPECPAIYEAECGSPEAMDLSPSVTGYPTAIFMGDTLNITDTLGDFCGIKSTYSDDTIALCGNAFKIIRTWRVIDCCAPNNPGIWTCLQIIKVSDYTSPVVTLPPTITASTDGNNCTSSNVVFPPALVSDCSGYSVRIQNPGGVIFFNGGSPQNPVPLGTHIITYVVTDECGNSTNATTTLVVEDNKPPSMVCESFTTVSITSDGTAQVQAISLDDGTNDDCCLDYFEARRMIDNCNLPQDTSFGPALNFCCEDVGDTLQVVLRAYDCSGNYNECMVFVRVDNKLEPIITCPQPITLNCEDDYNDLSVTGNIVSDPLLQGPNDGLASHNCPGFTIDYRDSLALNCGQGTVYRIWTVTDADGDEVDCIQEITLINTMPFDGNDITWPADTTLYGCNVAADTSVTGAPQFTADDCDNVLMYINDDTLFTFGGACIYIQRRFVLIDWCQYTPGTTGPGRWEHTQIIRILDTEAPIITGCKDKVFCNEDLQCQPLQVDLSIGISDACTDSALLQVTWVVDAFNDGIPDAGPQFVGSGMNINNSYPIGTHKITYYVEDDCGNVAQCEYLFKIIDCKAPTAICKNGLSTSLMANGTVTLNAEYFNNASLDNCSQNANLNFSFSVDIADSLMTFTCAELGINSVTMWVTDEIGNSDRCQTFIDIQDNMGVCPSNKASIAGSIKNASGAGVSNVTVQINGGASMNQNTTNSGAFEFENLTTGQDYTIAPFRNDDPRNGVSTIDIVLITKHILNVKKLDNPYKIIAADVNHTNSVTTLDLVAMRKLILHVANEFPNNTSWRFVNKDYLFPDRQDPFAAAFPEVFNINDLSNAQVKADFIAVKVGDVTGDAFPNNMAGVGNRTYNETTYLHTNNREVRRGDLVSIAFNSEKNESLMGCQFTLDFDTDALTMVDLKSSNWLSHENFGLVRINEGLLTFSWNQNEELENAGSAWFTLQFEAHQDGKISDWLKLSSQLTNAEAYRMDGSILNLDLVYDDGTSGNEGYSLYQNKPNPFSEGTTIGFNLPVSSTVQLSIFDVNGKLLKTLKGDFQSGYGEFNLNRNDLSTGVMYYRIDAPGFTDTKKMILVDSKP